MQIVIEIPDGIYKQILSDRYVIYDKIYYPIKNGTPLPEGHGRLIDGDMLFDNLVDGYENMNWDAVDAKEIIEAIEGATTVIEPYKAKSEE